LRERGFRVRVGVELSLHGAACTFDQRSHFDRRRRFGRFGTARRLELERAESTLSHIRESIERGDLRFLHAFARHPRIDQRVAEIVRQRVGEHARQPAIRRLGQIDKHKRIAPGGKRHRQ
jgi:hypothetical protein